MVINDSQNKNSKNAQTTAVDEIPSNELAANGWPPQNQLNTGSSDPTDGRKRWEWETRYPPQAVSEIRWEAIYLLILMFFALLVIFATWKEWVSNILSVPPESVLTLKQYTYYTASGMLGGVTFDIKYFYRSVARGWWHQDRRIWRMMSPFLAMTIALIVGAMIDAGLMATQASISGAASVTIGFLAGYFADHAVGKMYEIAMVIFGKTAAVKNGDGK
jgi:hypothetical protein